MKNGIRIAWLLNDQSNSIIPSSTSDSFESLAGNQTKMFIEITSMQSTVSSKKNKSRLHSPYYAEAVKRVTSGGDHLRGLGPGQHSPRNVAAAASRRQHCV